MSLLFPEAERVPDAAQRRRAVYRALDAAQ